VNIAALQVGQELEPYVVDAVDPERMKVMGAILRDPNPIHIDVRSVKALGMGDRVIVQGPMTLSFVTNMLARWAGAPDRLVSLAVRFQGNVFGGDRVECRGRITAIDEAAGQVTLDVEAAVDDRVVISGVAVVAG
jgi:acyl dehydratase